MLDATKRLMRASRDCRIMRTEDRDKNGVAYRIHWCSCGGWHVRRL